MPFVSDSQLATIADHVNSVESREQKRKLAEKLRTKEITAVVENAIGAAAVGYARGRYADAAGNFNLPRTTIPADFAVSFVALGAAFFGKDSGNHLLNLGAGALAGSTALYFNRHGVAAKAAGKFWAGDGTSEIVGAEIVSGVPEIVGSSPEIVGAEIYGAPASNAPGSPYNVWMRAMNDWRRRYGGHHQGQPHYGAAASDSDLADALKQGL